MPIPSIFQGIKKAVQRSWSAETGWVEKEIDFVRNGMNYASQDAIRVQYGGVLVSATKDRVEIQDTAIHGTPWNGYHYNQSRKMSAAEFMSDESLRSSYPEISEWLSAIA